jgi:M6 family metalloprotease-like protein
MSLHSKRPLAFTLLFLLCTLYMQAAWYNSLPFSIHQPDGTSLNCFVSGDEYHNWIHDGNGFTIVEGQDGYYYYAEPGPDGLIAGSYRAGSVNPSEVGLNPWLNIQEDRYQLSRNKKSASDNLTVLPPHAGLICNLVLFVRFSDDEEFTVTRATYDELFNASSSSSMKSYYREVSYNQLDITSGLYPASGPNTNCSYRDSYPRSYYLPYNASSNPGGYSSENERIQREHTLLKHAVEYMVINAQIPSSLIIDANSDGYVDNITFLVKGANSAWSQLLWSHSWQLFSEEVLIHGKRVWNYNLLPENQADLRTLCHEMFHSLGAPDLYHYQPNGIQPVGYWDIMETGMGHMGAWMKYRYSGHAWIAAIPEITHSGTYTLNPLVTPTGQCYRIASPYSSHEFFIIEYRHTEGNFESNLPGSGLLIYRIDTLHTGNSPGPPDEVYIYRPNGTLTINGSPSNAFYSLESGRTAINDATNPSCFLQDGSAGGLQIFDVGIAGNQITFKVQMNDVQPPVSLIAQAEQKYKNNLQWQLNADHDQVILVASKENQFGIPVNGYLFPVGSDLPGGGRVIYSGQEQEFIHEGLGSHENWNYRIYSLTGDLKYSNPVNTECTTLCSSEVLPYINSFDLSILPDCWEMQHSGSGTIDNWDISVSNYAGGTSYELRSTFQNVSNGVSRLVLPSLNTTGMSSLELKFRFMLDDWAPGAILRIQSSPDGINWTHENWNLPTASNSIIGPMMVQTPVLNNLNLESTFLAFVVEGNLYKYDFWYIDDISVTCSGFIPVEIMASENPPGSGHAGGGGTYPSTQPVILSATPNDGWGFLNWTENGEIVSTLPDYSFPANERTLVANFSTTQASLGLIAGPSCGGDVSGGGIYLKGTLVTATATAFPGYQFLCWKMMNETVSTENIYSFILNQTTNLEAVFTPPIFEQYSISLDALPAEGGQVLGSGNYYRHTLATVFAIPYAGWIFDSWQENGSILSRQPGFTFTVMKSYNLTAVFRQIIQVMATASPPEAGFTSGGGDYLTGNEAIIQAYGNPGWKFSKWIMNGTVLSPDSVFSFFPDNDCSLQAQFIPALSAYEMNASSWRVSPNPASTFSSIEYPPQERIREIRICNAEGRLISQIENTPLDNPVQLNLTSFLPGAYFIHVLTEDGTVHMEKLVKY